MSIRGGSVPLCDLQVQYRELQTEIEARVLQVLASGQVIQGPEVAALETEIAQYCGVAHAVGCSSGSDALLLALTALEIGPGDEVLTAPYTFFATAGSICRTGARPVFADIDPDTWNIDPRQVESRITPRTRALLPVHLFGQCADMEPLWSIAEKHNLVVIEDAAQALGSEYQHRKAGSLGGMGCFSFYPSKNLGAYGDAGMVVTSDHAWAERMACLRIHGMPVRYHHKYMGWNARLDALQAAILRVKLPHLDRWVEARRMAARRYDELIGDYQLDEQLTRPAVTPDRKHSFNQYVVKVANGQRDGLMRHLRSENIGCEVYYPVPLHLQESLALLGYHAGDFPVSEEASRSVLALPLFPEITVAQQERVISACSAYLYQRSRMAA
jgi:dTDP-4-amino-4,6-dideoxygalactose transaminase